MAKFEETTRENIHAPFTTETVVSPSIDSGIPKERQKLLVVCVDRDDDVGRKAKVPTPIIGREKCIQAANAVAIADPEEADANAIFAAVSEYDKLSRDGTKSEVAIVAGKYEAEVEADRKIRREVLQVVGNFGPDGIVLVSDGVEDEKVLPVLQAIAPIVSVRRVLVKHSKSVEESYAILGKYLRMLAYDPRYSRFALGVPGLIILVTAVIAAFSTIAAFLVFSILVGAAFIVRGFDIDKKIWALTQLSSSGYLRLSANVVGLLVFLAGIALGIQGVYHDATAKTYLALIYKDSSTFFLYAPYLIGVFIEGAILFMWIGMGISIAGSLFFNLLRNRFSRSFRNGVELVTLAFLFVPLSEFGLVLINKGTGPLTLLAIALAVLFLTMVSGLVIAYYLGLRRRITVT
jgi:putative membrane protein